MDRSKQEEELDSKSGKEEELMRPFKKDEIESMLQVWIDLSTEKNWIPKAEKWKCQCNHSKTLVMPT